MLQGQKYHSFATIKESYTVNLSVANEVESGILLFGFLKVSLTKMVMLG